jgi:hypothetical protein
LNTAFPNLHKYISADNLNLLDGAINAWTVQVESGCPLPLCFGDQIDRRAEAIPGFQPAV